MFFKWILFSVWMSFNVTTHLIGMEIMIPTLKDLAIKKILSCSHLLEKARNTFDTDLLGSLNGPVLPLEKITLDNTHYPIYSMPFCNERYMAICGRSGISVWDIITKTIVYTHNSIDIWDCDFKKDSSSFILIKVKLDDDLRSKKMCIVFEELDMFKKKLSKTHEISFSVEEEPRMIFCGSNLTKLFIVFESDTILVIPIVENVTNSNLCLLNIDFEGSYGLGISVNGKYLMKEISNRVSIFNINDLSDPKRVFALEFLESKYSKIYAAALSPDNRYFVISFSNFSLIIFDLNKNVYFMCNNFSAEKICSIRFSPTGRLIAFAFDASYKLDIYDFWDLFNKIEIDKGPTRYEHHIFEGLEKSFSLKRFKSDSND